MEGRNDEIILYNFEKLNSVVKNSGQKIYRTTSLNSEAKERTINLIFSKDNVL